MLSTDFKEFPKQTNYTVVAGKDREEVTNYALDWTEHNRCVISASDL
jgi:hypothetical protein